MTKTYDNVIAQLATAFGIEADAEAVAHQLTACAREMKIELRHDASERLERMPRAIFECEHHGRGVGENTVIALADQTFDILVQRGLKDPRKLAPVAAEKPHVPEPEAAIAEH